VTAPTGGDTARLRAALATVHDPEIRVLTIEELGIPRQVDIAPDGRAHITLTPTYLGCPAMDAIRADLRAAARAAGYPGARIDTVRSPPWTTRWLSDAARGKLRAAGIAPPAPQPPPAPPRPPAPASSPWPPPHPTAPCAAPPTPPN
jgi:ring-1,2-phenylacetyl-CoA epoxidase subunit PaaD